MKSVSFLFDQLRSLSFDTELLEASDWSDKKASESMDRLRNLILKYENKCQSIEDLERNIRIDLKETNTEQSIEALLKIFREIANQSLTIIRQESN